MLLTLPINRQLCNNINSFMKTFTLHQITHQNFRNIFYIIDVINVVSNIFPKILFN